MYKIEERVKWIQKKVKEANADGVAIAISGGIDSAVIAALCKKAFPNNTFGVFLDINSSQSSSRNFLRLIEFLKIEQVKLDLTDEYNNLFKKLFEVPDKYKDPKTYEHFLKTGEAPIDMSYLENPNLNLIKGNLKARIRMASIYAKAQEKNYLVMETSNLAEDKLGYYTKWGDGVGDIAPITDLHKSEVFGLAKELGIPQIIIDTAIPSADLWEGQTDEEELGFKYNEFEDFYKGKDISKESKNKIELMIEKNKHKKDGVYKFIEEYEE